MHFSAISAKFISEPSLTIHSGTIQVHECFYATN